MALETATYVAALVVTNPDGGDARSTADDHIRLLKAALVRTFPKMDGAVSLSSTQVMYLNDVSASVQAQLNTLRDGSATANFAVNSRYANSASTAANIGTIPAARVPDLAAAPNTFTGTGEVIRFTSAGATVAWYLNGIGSGIIQCTSADGFQVYSGAASQMFIGRSGACNLIFESDGTITVNGTLDGTITSAQNAAVAAQATNATNAANATFASTCTSASSAALLSGFGLSTDVQGSTLALRSSTGDLFMRYLNVSSSENESAAPSNIGVFQAGENYMRKMSLAAIGQSLEARNITDKSGTRKTLSAGSGPPSLSGSTNGDVFFYY